jgi:hypothetical protein
MGRMYVHWARLQFKSELTGYGEYDENIDRDDSMQELIIAKQTLQTYVNIR